MARARTAFHVGRGAAFESESRLRNAQPRRAGGQTLDKEVEKVFNAIDAGRRGFVLRAVEIG